MSKRERAWNITGVVLDAILVACILWSAGTMIAGAAW